MKKYAVFMTLLILFSAVPAEGPGKGNMIPFDFPDLTKEEMSARYHRYGYRERRKPHLGSRWFFPRIGRSSM